MSKTWVLACVGTLTFAAAAVAGRPLTTNDADALERGKVQRETLMLDVAVGTKLACDWPHWTATAGLTWVF